jgi:drug/metabolite transporter (DMT)-like permease
MVLLDWLRPGGVRPRAVVAVGLAIGLGGVGLLAGGSGVAREPGHGWGVAAVLAASLGWALGSIFNRSARKPASPFLAVAMQMTAGGVLLLVLAAVRGEANRFSLAEMSPQSFGAWVYLTLAGSLVAYTAYVWLLHATTPARVATYAYVNPLIAVLLGCTLGHESFSKEMFAAGGLIILAVALIVSGGARPASPAKRDAASVQAPACAASEIS